jgi:hypothetical protein
MIARSAQSGLGRAIWRRSTVTSCHKTIISALANIFDSRRPYQDSGCLVLFKVRRYDGLAGSGMTLAIGANLMMAVPVKLAFRA